MSAERKFRVALAQMALCPDPQENLEKAIARVEQAAQAGAEVICLPELFRSLYFCQREDPAAFDLAEPVPGPSTQALGEVARKLRIVVVAPVFERRAPGLYHNTAAVIDSGELVGLYRKMHIPDDPAYYEKFYFTPGDLGFQAFPTRVGRIGTLICWDQWYPEGARLTVLQGAAILFYPTAIGWHPDEKEACGAAQRDAWRTVQRGHAIANGVYVAAVNRVGHEKPVNPSSHRPLSESTPIPQGGKGLPSTGLRNAEESRSVRAGRASKTGAAGPVPSPSSRSRGIGMNAAEGIEFWGSSFLCDPYGVVLAEASTDREEILYGEVDPHRIEEVRRNWPFLRDRRVDAYSGLDQRFLNEEGWGKKS